MASEPTSVPGSGTVVDERLDDETLVITPWVTIVWDDPVNLMSYVSHVFANYFNYTRQCAERLMMQVHMEGRAVVSTGTREAMERDVQAMHSYGLWATMDKAQ